MATSGAYSGQSFSFNYSFVDAATPTQFFATDLATTDITVYSRTGSTTGAGANIASAPTRTGTLFTFTLSTSEMTGDEVIVQVTASGMVPETISIALQPTPSDISEVTQTAVSGISDFQGSGGGSTGPTEAEIYTYFTSSSRQDAFKATGFNTVAPDNASISAILADTNELQQNQNNWLTATGFSTHSATDVRNSLQAVAGDFKATGFATVNPDNASISAILTDTNELQQNQNNWLTATGFSTFNHTTDQVVASNMRGTDGAVTTDAPTAADVYTYFTDGSREDVFKASGFATVNADNASIAAILADTNELQQNQGDWATATGFSTHSATDVRNSLQAVAGDFKADVSGLSTFDSTTDSVTVGTNNDKTGYVLTQTFPSNFSTLIIGTGADAGKVTTSNPAAGSGSAHTAADVAALILETPANKLATNASGQVESSNMRGTDNAATSSQVSALNDFNPAVDAVANVTTVGSVTNPVETDTASRNASKANVSGLSTFDPSTDEVTTDAASRSASQANVASLLTTADFNAALPTGFGDLIIGSGGDLGKVTTSNPAAGSGSAHTAQDVANLILATPANKLATDGSGRVTAENMRGTDGANTTAPDNASIAAILADTNELQGNQGDWATATGFSTHSATDVRNSLQAVANDFKADVSSLASQSSVTAVDNVVDAIKVKTDQLTFSNPGEVDANAVTGGGGGGATAAEVYTYFTDGSREDVFKADVSSLSTFDPGTQTVTTDSASRAASKADVSGLSTFNASTDTVTTDSASREASKANVSGLATSAQINGLNDFDPSSQDVTFSTAQAQALADEVLKRSVSNTQDSADAHSLAAIVLGILESQRTGASWTIRKTDGSTFATKSLTLDSGASPVTGVD